MANYTDPIKTKDVWYITSDATPDVCVDKYNHVHITALATAITSMTSGLSGTPVDFQTLTYRIKDDGTGRAITWGASFVARGYALPTTTVASKITYVVFKYNSTAAIWECVGRPQEI